jgi:hypothetical protein
MYKLNMTRRAIGTAAIALFFATAVQAQQPGRIRGQIEKVDGATYVLKARDGTMLNVKLADNARLLAFEKASLNDIKNDSFLGIAGMPRPDDSIEAFSIHIFLPAQRGAIPERHGPWDARPGSTMTNAYVTSIVKEKDGEMLTVKHKDGEKRVAVTPQTVIAAAAPGNKEELKSGAQIIIFGWDKQADGSILAKSLYVGRSLTPAM